DVAKGWDLADAATAGWTTDDVLAHMRSAIPLEAPSNASTPNVPPVTSRDSRVSLKDTGEGTIMPDDEDEYVAETNGAGTRDREKYTDLQTDANAWVHPLGHMNGRYYFY